MSGKIWKILAISIFSVFASSETYGWRDRMNLKWEESV